MFSVFPGHASAKDVEKNDQPLVIITLPYLSLKEVTQVNTPNIFNFIQKHPLANLSLRTENGPKTSSIYSAYATINSGIRTNATRKSTLLLTESELPKSKTNNQLANLVGSSIEVTDGPYEAKLGTLGDVLKQNKIKTYAYGNADYYDYANNRIIPRRQASYMLSNSSGKITKAVLARNLDQKNDFLGSVTTNYDLVIKEMAEDLPIDSVSIVEMSNLIRVADKYYFPNLKNKENEIINTDEYVGKILELAKEKNAKIMMFSPSTTSVSNNPYGFITTNSLSDGLLTSQRTKIDGFVALPDITASIMNEFDIQYNQIDGSPIGVKSISSDKKLDAILELRGKSVYREKLVKPFSIFLIGILGMIVALIIARIFFQFNSKFFSSLGFMVLYSLLFSYVLIPTILYKYHYSVGISLILGLSALLSYLSKPFWLIWVVSSFWIVSVVSLLLPNNVFLTDAPFGNGLVGGGRFYGLGNVPFALMVFALILVVVILNKTENQVKHKNLISTVLSAATLFVANAPFLGADVGSIIAGIPCVVLLFISIGKLKLNVKVVTLMCLSILGFLALWLFIDLHLPQSQQTHLAKLWNKYQSGGFEVIESVITRKLSYIVSQVQLQNNFIFFFIPAPFYLLLLMRRYNRSLWDLLNAGKPWIKPLLISVAGSSVIQGLLNDSGFIIPAFFMLMTLSVLSVMMYDVLLQNKEIPNEKVG